MGWVQVKRKFLAETVNLPETKSGNVILRAHKSTLQWHAFFFIATIRRDGGGDRLGANIIIPKLNTYTQSKKWCIMRGRNSCGPVNLFMDVH